MAANLWHSDRLVYRAVEAEDDTFLESLNHDSRLFTQAASVIPIPQGKKGGTFLREMMEKDLLGVVICLPAPAPTAVQSTPSTESGAPAAAPAAAAISKPIPIGMIALWTEGGEKMSHHRNAEMGLNILPTHQAQGYGTEAILWALRFGFKMANLHRIHLASFEWNQGAIRLYEKLGFVLEGRAREHLWFDGRYWDLIEFGILEREWRERYGGDGKSGKEVK